MIVLSWSCSWFGVPGGHEDVIMNVLSWCGSFLAVVLSWCVLSWFGSCSFLVRCSWWPCRCHHESSLMAVLSWSFAVIYPCRCHHESSLMVWFVPGGGSLFRGSQSFIHEDVIMNVLSWFGSQSFIRADVIMNILSWWCSWFGVPGGHVDVIMIVLSWPCRCHQL